MDKKTLQELSEVIQSSNINFLFGAGASTPFLPLLGNIEQLLNETNDESKREEHYKKYFTDVMLPNKKLALGEDLSKDANYQTTLEAYENFFLGLSELILQRKSTILSKQVNLFTTNVDVLMEKILEELQMEYNDGFSGKFKPTFSISNFKKSTYQRSLHFEHISEIPVLNIIKIHGSLTWKHDNTGEKIEFSHNLTHFAENLSSKTGKDFSDEYKKILVVNPEEAKHLESVLNVYYSELIRMYSSELEKENATLFTVGFSMEDKHIREITLRAAKSNPTLRIFIGCSKKSEEGMKAKMEVTQHPNIQVFTPEKHNDKFTLEYFTQNILGKVSSKPIIEDYGAKQ
ncbi:MAG: SIR2 family protein [Fulvivirga sp.]